MQEIDLQIDWIGYQPLLILGKAIKTDWVNEKDQAAFKAEMSELRKQLKVISKGRWEQNPDLYPALRANIDKCLDRITYWRGVLQAGKLIRPPVGLWVRWNRLKLLVEINNEELNKLEGKSHKSPEAIYENHVS